MAKFLLVSNYGDAAFLGLRLKREGHNARIFIKYPTCKDIYKGLLDHATSMQPERDECVIVDSEGFGKYADVVRKRGNPTIGGGAWADAIELDRPAGIGLMDMVGIRTPETHPFSSIDDGVKFLRNQEGSWYYKPCNNCDAAMSFGGTVDILSRFINKYPAKEFILQKKVDGTELSFEGWFDGAKFVYPFNSTVEDKRFLPGDIGPNVGCMGNVVWTYDDPKPTLALRTLDRIVPNLQRVGYVGPIDINTIISDDGIVYGLEWTPRFGYDAIQGLSLLAPENFGEQLYSFAKGELPRFDLRGEYAFVLNISTPPYPNATSDTEAQKAKGLPLDQGIINHPTRIMPRDVMLDNLGLPVIAGSSGIVGCFGNIGKNLQSLRDETFAFVKQFKIPNAQYRNDCCNRAEGVIAKLETLGFDKPFMAPDVEPPRQWDIPAPSLPRYPAPTRSPGATITPLKSNPATLQYHPATPTTPPRFE